MPIALSGNQTWKYFLRTDRPKGPDGKAIPIPPEGLPAGTPCIILKHLTGREQWALATALDAFEKPPENSGSAEYVNACYELASRAGIVSWEFTGPDGKPIPFDPARLEDVLQFQEAREIAYAAWRGGLTSGDLGNSDLPSNTAGAGSANPADAKTA